VKLVSFGEAFFILLAERGVMPKEGLWMVQDYIDDHSFSPPPSRAANDPTGVPIFPPEEGRGDDFQPFNVEYHDFHINPLPKEPLEFFFLGLG
jgi:hypothetical protein